MTDNTFGFELPYPVIDIEHQNAHFMLQLLRFADGQTDETAKTEGLHGQFGIIYEDSGISCGYEIDCSVSSIRDFMLSLDSVYDNLTNSSTAALVNYGTEENTFLSVTFLNDGGLSIKGRFCNMASKNKGTVSFEFDIGRHYKQECVSDMLCSMEKFIHQLYEIQGHSRYN